MIRFLLQVVDVTNAKSNRNTFRELNKRVGAEVIMAKQVKYGEDVVVNFAEEDVQINIGAHKELFNDGSSDICIVADDATIGLRFIDFYETEESMEEEEMEEYVEECV